MNKKKKMDKVTAMKLIDDDVIKDLEIVHGILETTLTAFDAEISRGFWGEVGKSYAIEAAVKDSLVKLESAIKDLCRYSGRECAEDDCSEQKAG
jgi:hypothetical protein